MSSPKNNKPAASHPDFFKQYLQSGFGPGLDRANLDRPRQAPTTKPSPKPQPKGKKK